MVLSEAARDCNARRVPLFKQGELLGVLDVDSSRRDRFSREDEEGLMALADVYLSSIV